MEVEVMIADVPKPRTLRAAYLLSAMVAVLSAAVSLDWPFPWSMPGTGVWRRQAMIW
jgi:hypothetical protein